jgi:hypothetical protein
MRECSKFELKPTRMYFRNYMVAIMFISCYFAVIFNIIQISFASSLVAFLFQMKISRNKLHDLK